MNVKLRLCLAFLAPMTIVACFASGALAQTTPPGLLTGFESTVSPSNPYAYQTGGVIGALAPGGFSQDNWSGGDRGPRVQTAAEISAELANAGLNPAGSVHSGDQALMVVKYNELNGRQLVGSTAHPGLRLPFHQRRQQLHGHQQDYWRAAAKQLCRHHG
jgi:hypothetical protein